MFTSFSTALSALDAMSTAIDVVGNNLANLNTPGFKDSTTYFRDLVTESLGAGLGAHIGKYGGQLGIGVAEPSAPRPVALTIPVVTVPFSPPGEPMTTMLSRPTM